jgi:hypothetical protein
MNINILWGFGSMIGLKKKESEAFQIQTEQRYLIFASARRALISYYKTLVGS